MVKIHGKYGSKLKPPPPKKIKPKKTKKNPKKRQAGLFLKNPLFGQPCQFLSKFIFNTVRKSTKTIYFCKLLMKWSWLILKKQQFFGQIFFYTKYLKKSLNMLIWNMCLLKYHVDKEFLGFMSKILFWEILQHPSDDALGVGIQIHSFCVLRIQICWYGDLNPDPLQIFLMDLWWNFQSFNLLKIKNLVNGLKVKDFCKEHFFC